MIERYFEFFSSEDHEKIRLDIFITRHIGEISRSRGKKLIESGCVSVNDNIIKDPSFLIKKNLKIEVRLPFPTPSQLIPKDIPLDIRYEDEHLLIINKPANMVVHPGAGKENSTLVNALLFHCKDLSGIGGVERPGIVHRLDKDTTGLMIVAKDDITHRELSKAFKDRTIKKTYYAIVSGILNANCGSINRGIKRDPIHRKKMCVSDINSRLAITHWTLLKRLKGHSFLEIKIQTGRTHQIRVHLSSIGHPILGDVLYGGRRKININGQCFDIPRYMLHSGKLEFVHPIKEKEMKFFAEIPDDMNNFLDILCKTD